MTSAMPAELTTLQFTLTSVPQISGQQYVAPIRRQIQAGSFNHSCTGQKIVRTAVIDANPMGQNSILIAMHQTQNTTLNRKSP